MKKLRTFGILLFVLFSVSIFAQVTKKIQGQVKSSEKGVENVLITDGKQFVKTDKKGKFTLFVENDRSFIYYTLPSQFNSPLLKGIPQFYKKINDLKANEKIVFNIEKVIQNQNHHSFIVWADPQVKELEEFDLLQKVVDDTKQTLKSLGNIPIHGIACGDLVFDELSFFDRYKDKIAQMQIPFYQVIGNHDMDYNQKSNFESDKSFSDSFGPSYYSYNVGQVHYITLKDVFYYGYSYRYIGYLDEIQLKWLEKDLSFVPKGSTVIISLHIPTVYGETEKPNYETLLSNSVMNRKELFRILEGYKVHLTAGHSHTQWNTSISENILEHTHAAVCGAWWQGDYCTDGSPIGYTVYEVNDNDIKWYFKGVGFDKNEQLKIYPTGSDTDYPDNFIVNVFNYDDKWKVEWFENEVYMGEMTQYWAVDPLAKHLYRPGENKKYSWLRAGETHHLFRAVPKNQTTKIKVVVTDRFGTQYTRLLN